MTEQRMAAVEQRRHGLRFCCGTGEVWYEGRVCHVTATQMDILESLVDAYPRQISYAQLIEEVWPEARLDVSEQEAQRYRTNMASQTTHLRNRMRDGGLAVTIVGQRRQFYVLLLGEEAHARNARGLYRRAVA